MALLGDGAPHAGRARRARPEAGFTLIELLMVLVITGILVPAITEGLIIGLKVVNQSSASLNQSDDRQLLDYYLPRDVLSSSSASTTELTPACFTTSPANQMKLSLAWVQVTLSGSPPVMAQTYVEVDYVLSTAPGVQGQGQSQQLERYQYSYNNVTLVCTLTSQQVVANNLSYAAGPSAVVTVVGSGATAGQVSLTLTDTSGSYLVNGQARQ
jgi:prepilin-type N-terminal cleavage/methylation domain-containing protein